MISNALTKTLAAAFLALALAGCADYQSHVASRTDVVDVWVKDDSGGGGWTHTVVYKGAFAK